jgi:hypothetical protein
MESGSEIVFFPAPALFLGLSLNCRFQQPIPNNVPINRCKVLFTGNDGSAHIIQISVNRLYTIQCI